MELTVLSWNVEHFNGSGGKDEDNQAARKTRVADVIEEIRRCNVDVFALMEVEGKDVYERITRSLSGFAFSITEGVQSQEILIGVSTEFTSFCTQRREFKESNPYLRPGALLTVSQEGEHVSILFLHLKSSSSPEGFGLRDSMFDKTLSLKKSLDEKATEYNGGVPTKAHFIVVGDLNTMGMNYHGRQHDVSAASELQHVTQRFVRNDMRRLRKSHSLTYNGGSKSSYQPSDLDHVFAANHLSFENVTGAEVQVRGWAMENTSAKQDKWIDRYSDHAPLWFKLLRC